MELFLITNPLRSETMYLTWMSEWSEMIVIFNYEPFAIWNDVSDVEERMKRIDGVISADKNNFDSILVSIFGSWEYLTSNRNLRFVIRNFQHFFIGKSCMMGRRLDHCIFAVSFRWDKMNETRHIDRNFVAYEGNYFMTCSRARSFSYIIKNQS